MTDAHPASGRSLGPDDKIDAVLKRHPECTRVFLELRMACPGCPMARLVTLAEAAAVYGLAVETLIAALEAAPAA